MIKAESIRINCIFIESDMTKDSFDIGWLLNSMEFQVTSCQSGKSHMKILKLLFFDTYDGYQPLKLAENIFDFNQATIHFSDSGVHSHSCFKC